MIKGILMDYGGTIDTNGIHWANVFWDFYQQLGVPVTPDLFKAAYVHGERALALNPLVKPHHNFEDVLGIKIGCQFDYLVQHGLLGNSNDYSATIDQIARLSNQFALTAIAAAKPILEQLTSNYPVVLVSNFYGNIHAVLDSFELTKYFKTVVESAVVGVRKPDPAIFTLGANALQLPPNECVVIGDSYTKDIAPGSAAGCKTIWLKAAGWGDDPNDVSLADVVIQDFAALPEVIKQF